MYQSAAYGLIPSQQKCFDIPMVRRPIFRTSVDQSLGFDLGSEDPSVAVINKIYYTKKINYININYSPQMK